MSFFNAAINTAIAVYEMIRVMSFRMYVRNLKNIVKG